MISSSEPSSSKPDFQTLVDQSTVEGVQAGIMGFLTHNRVKLHPTKKCEKPLEAFVHRLLSEYTPTPEGYPLKDSIKDAILVRIGEIAHIVKALYEEGNLDTLVHLVHIETGEAVAGLLEKNRLEVLTLINKEIRGE